MEPQIEYDIAEVKEVLYNYHLGIQLECRNKDIEFLEKKEFSKLRDSRYVHRKEHIIDIIKKDIDSVLSELTEIKLNIPNNAADVCVNGRYEGTEDEGIVSVTYYLYSIVGAEKCKRLAESFASTDAWKVKYQPNGRDAKAALVIYEKYKKK